MNVVHIVKALIILSMFLAESALAQVPYITEHTPLIVAAQRGDIVVMGIKVDRPLGAAVELRWTRYGEVICRDLECTLETANLGLGDHKIVVTLKTQGESRSLRLRLKVLATPPGYRPTTIKGTFQPAAEDVIQLSGDDFYVEAVAGHALIKRQGKFKVIGNAAQPLGGISAIIAEKDGVVRFGRPGVEEHIMTPKTRLGLSNTPAGRRRLDLQRGTLRTRTISSGEPRWSLVVADRLQIDPGRHSDLVVGLGPKQNTVLLTVLRGQVRVTRTVPPNDRDDSVSRQQFTVPQGVYARIDLDDSAAVAYQLPPLKSLQRIFALTSPQYVPDHDSSWTGEMAAHSAESIAGLMENRDFVAALQEMMRIPRSQWNTNQLGLIAKCYAGIFQYRLAKLFLDKALGEGMENPTDLLALQGAIALAERRWSDAITSYEQAMDQSDQEGLHYYTGVAEYNLGNKAKAEGAFTYALWNDLDDELRRSSREFLTALDEQTWVRAFLSIGLKYDSHVPIAWSPEDQKWLSRVGKGYEADLGVRLQFLSQPLVRLSLDIDAHHRGWQDDELLDANGLRLSTRLSLSVFLPGSRSIQQSHEDAVFAFGLSPLLASEAVGKIRSANMAGADVWVGVPRWFGLKALLESRVISDPSPGQENLMDPVLREPTAAVDRSAKTLGLGLAVAPIDDDQWSADIQMWQRAAYFRDELAQSDGHTSLDLDATVTYRPSPRYEWLGGIHSSSRQFTDTTISRKDTRAGYRLRFSWHYTPALWIAMDASSQTQSSNVQNASYARQTFGLLTGLSL